MNLLMIHVTKTAGSSLREILFPGKPTEHKFAGDYSAEEWRRSFTFGFVRNPYQRWASSYVHHTSQRYRGNLLRGFPELKSLSFEDYLRKVVIPSKGGWAASQYEVLMHPVEGLPKFIGRFERLAEDAAELFRKIGLEGVELPHVNANSVSNYDHLLGKRERKLIEGRFWQDFEVFDYPLIS